METTKKWGDDKTLMALAQVLNCDIEVPSSVDGKFIPPYTALDSIHQTLKIGHIAESHYMALAPQGIHMDSRFWYIIPTQSICVRHIISD